jgi:hypothetical protein
MITTGEPAVVPPGGAFRTLVGGERRDGDQIARPPAITH